MIKKERALNCHTLLLEGRRKPEDKDVGKAAHAYGVRTACFLASSENFLRFLTQVKAIRFLLIQYVYANILIDTANLRI